ncbi:UNVERIFIED_CONTAM: hypothetical protein RMT77_015480 [Armadillidium vulgare]
MDLSKILFCLFLIISMVIVFVESSPVPGPNPDPSPVPEPKWKRKFPGQRRIGSVNYGFYNFGAKGYQIRRRGH